MSHLNRLEDLEAEMLNLMSESFRDFSEVWEFLEEEKEEEFEIIKPASIPSHDASSSPKSTTPIDRRTEDSETFGPVRPAMVSLIDDMPENTATPTTTTKPTQSLISNTDSNVNTPSSPNLNKSSTTPNKNPDRSHSSNQSSDTLPGNNTSPNSSIEEKILSSPVPT